MTTASTSTSYRSLFETPSQVVLRVCRPFRNKRSILVLNDEAHHCYREKPADPEEEALKGEDRKEAEANKEAARLWISGLEAVNRKLGLQQVVHHVAHVAQGGGVTGHRGLGGVHTGAYGGP